MKSLNSFFFFLAFVFMFILFSMHLVNSMDLVRLRNGAKVSRKIVSSIIKNIEKLRNEDGVVFYELVGHCKFDNDLDRSTVERLAEFNLLFNAQKGFTPEYVKNILLSAIGKEDHFGVVLVDPILKKKSNRRHSN